MGHSSPGHPRVEPRLWPLVTMGAILAVQISLLQVAVNRLSWGMYREVLVPAMAVLGLSIVAWLLYRQVDRDMGYSGVTDPERSSSPD